MPKGAFSMVSPTREEFVARAARGNLIPVYREILADMETPVSAFKKIGGRPHSFLLESVAGGERIGRYSFIGGDPFLILKTKGRSVELRTDGETQRRELEPGEDPLTVLKGLMSGFRFVGDDDLPPFCGGAVGYIGYDTVRFFERLPERAEDDRSLPDCYFILTDTLLIFDHVRHKIKVLCLARVNGECAGRGSASGPHPPGRVYDEAVAKVEQLARTLRQARPGSGEGLTTETRRHGEEHAGSDDLQGDPLRGESVRRPVAERLTTTMTQPEYEAAVVRAKEYIAAGDIIQVVLSQRQAVEITCGSFDVYRALRSVNPSPYMFYLCVEECQLVGASPEILVTEREGAVTTRPIAGTVRRGRTPAEDALLEAQLLADPKERAEHVMLVDLHRNDIGRVCQYGSVRVDELMVTERYSHVIHIVSNVVGRLRPECDGYDLLRATFPAGTLSGAPKIRAMEIIEELEPKRRGPYGGAIGYFSFSGDMDTCITLRTIVVQGSTAYLQAGAGIVADSVPATEFAECMSKAGALLGAIEMAEAGLE
jgi:anthranilate synthase component 1